MVQIHQLRTHHIQPSSRENSHSLLVSTTLSPKTSPQSEQTFAPINTMSVSLSVRRITAAGLPAYQVSIRGLLDDVRGVDLAVLANQSDIQVLSEGLLWDVKNGRDVQSCVSR